MVEFTNRKESWQNVLVSALVALLRLLNLAEGFLVHFAVTNLWLKLNCRPFMSSPLLSGFVELTNPKNISFAGELVTQTRGYNAGFTRVSVYPYPFPLLV